MRIQRSKNWKVTGAIQQQHGDPYRIDNSTLPVMTGKCFCVNFDVGWNVGVDPIECVFLLEFDSLFVDGKEEGVLKVQNIEVKFTLKNETRIN
jgi:hypothetical protein